MRLSTALCALLLLLGAFDASAQSAPPPKPLPFEPELQESEMVKLPTGVLLIKGTEPSASDSTTPVPESGQVVYPIPAPDRQR